MSRVGLLRKTFGPLFLHQERFCDEAIQCLFIFSESRHVALAAKGGSRRRSNHFNVNYELF
jgi:hypothetical protein